MSNYAFLDENNVVTDIIAGVDKSELIEGKTPEEWYGAFKNQVCKLTGESDMSRKNHAGIGDTYDEERDAFITPQPTEDAVFDEETCQWIIPSDTPSEITE
jgi:hypothetical protein